jgi:hypothetical protein
MDHRHAEHLAPPVAVEADSDYHGNRHDPPALAHLHKVASIHT